MNKELSDSDLKNPMDRRCNLSSLYHEGLALNHKWLSLGDKYDEDVMDVQNLEVESYVPLLLNVLVRKHY